jgi:ADP-dependent NAD(P)H-hydrate dehydratase / NAD(P)H-hydrate epimerase
MKLVDSAGMQTIDRRAQEEYGIPALLLMESAGLLAWVDLRTRFGSGRPSICAVAGRGNNGGDALVMARYAILDGFPVMVVLAAPSDALGELSGLHAGILRRLGAPVLEWSADEDACRAAIDGAELIIDGLAGTGIKGALRAPLDGICVAINGSKARVAAVDAPSGLGDDWRPGMPVVDAEVTLTMGLPKTCLYGPRGRLHCGEIRRIQLSFPSALVNDPGLPGTLLEPDDLGRLLAPLTPDMYKHKRGVVAVFAGAVGTTGAAVLAADAAARCRAGMVTIYVDPEIYSVVAPAVRSVMVRPFGPGADLPANADAAIVGPGWGVSETRATQLGRS